MERALPGLVAGILLAALLVAVTPIGWLPAWLMGLGVVTFAVYGWDKQRAKSDGRRVPEAALHALSLGGGVLGGWAGRQVFRHKTRKPVFTVVLAVATVLWAAIAVVVLL